MENGLLGTKIEVNVIYDCRHSERFDQFSYELKRQGIEKYEVWPAMVLPHSVVESISESHKMIVADAKARHLPMTCIMEDDVMIPHENGWDYFLSCMPTVFDIYSAGNYSLTMRKVRAGAILVPEIIGFHCYIVHSRYYDTFLATSSADHIDAAQKSNLMYSCFPLVALQRPGFSANTMKVVNYNSGFNVQPEWVYGNIIP